MRTGWAAIGDTQYLPGYCVLLADAPDVDHLLDLPRSAQVDFLTDMALLGEAVFHACNGLDPAFRRVNYEVLGNSMRQLHAHVHARYAWEPEQYRLGPVWRYPDDLREAPEHLLGEQHDGLRDAITIELERVMRDAYGTLPAPTASSKRRHRRRSARQGQHFPVTVHVACAGGGDNRQTTLPCREDRRFMYQGAAQPHSRTP
ncbi:hypothetical protein ACFQX7_05905 [Luedemannella flava]